MEAVGVVRERPGLHLAAVSGHALLYLVTHVREVLHEFGHKIREHAEEILSHKHLAGAVRPRADTDGHAGHFTGDAFGQQIRHALEHHAEGAGLVESAGVIEQFLGRGHVLSLHMEATQRVEGLRGEADMPHDRNAGLCHGPHLRADFPAALKLDGMGPAFLHEPSGVADSVLHAYLEAQERHIAHEQGVTRSAGDAERVMHHIVHGHGHRVGHAHHDHSERIAHEDHIRASGAHKAGHGVVVRRDHGDFLAPVLSFQQ